MGPITVVLISLCILREWGIHLWALTSAPSTVAGCTVLAYWSCFITSFKIAHQASKTRVRHRSMQILLGLMGNTPGHNRDVSVSAKQMISRGVKSGFLTKVGATFKSWKRRYFVFDGYQLVYFETEQSPKQKGEIKCADITRVARADEDVDKPYALVLETPHRHYYLIASSEQDIEEWRMVLSGDLENIIDSVEQLCRKVNTELLGTNDDQLEQIIGELQDLITDSRNALYSCGKGKVCANKADVLITQAISALQQRRRVYYGMNWRQGV